MSCLLFQLLQLHSRYHQSIYLNVSLVNLLQSSMLLCHRRCPNSERPHEMHAILTRTSRPPSHANGLELLGKAEVATSCYLCCFPACTPCFHPRRKIMMTTNPETSKKQETTRTLPECFAPHSGRRTPRVSYLKIGSGGATCSISSK